LFYIHKKLLLIEGFFVPVGLDSQLKELLYLITITGHTVYIRVSRSVGWWKSFIRWRYIINVVDWRPFLWGAECSLPFFQYKVTGTLVSLGQRRCFIFLAILLMIQVFP